jgi:tRNA(fMet)-specific endonuclease VapC
LQNFAVDTNAVVDFLRPERISPPELIDRRNGVFLPLPVAGELFFGVAASRQQAQQDALEGILLRWTVLSADIETAKLYGMLRAQVAADISSSKRNDFWIAALCLQHDLPLLTNDRGFDSIAGLTVVHW